MSNLQNLFGGIDLILMFFKEFGFSIGLYKRFGMFLGFLSCSVSLVFLNAKATFVEN